MIRAYAMLTKPGILLGNLITTAAGFALASGRHFNPWLFLQTLIGLGLIIASACVFNNYMDRHADAKMARTKNRPFVRKTVSVPMAIALALLLGLGGVVVLGLYTNTLALLVALTGFLFYVGLYTTLKHRMTSGTLIGSVAGAVPPVVGYCAVRGELDLGAGLLFITLFLWQMPHFYAIAIYRLKEYIAASIPVLPVRRGVFIAKLCIAAYIALFTIAMSLFTILGLMGMAYLAVMLVLSLIWLGLSLRGFWVHNNAQWARKLFQFSLVVIMAFSFLLILKSAPQMH